MAATFSFEDAVQAPKAGLATFSFDEALGTPQRELPSGIKPSTAGGGRGSAVDPRRTDAPAAPEAPAFSDPSGSGDGAAIMNSGGPARSSVLEGIQMDAPVTNTGENLRLSNRAYAEDSAVVRKPGPSASRIDGKTIPINNSGTLSRAGDLVASQLDSYSAGLGYRAGDAAALVGADKAAANLRGRASNLQDRSDTTSQSVSLSADGAFEKYAPQILAVFPTMAVAAASGGLPVMFGVAELQQYAEGRKAGLNPMMALGRSVPMGAAEVIGEKLGGTGKLLEALEKAAVKGGSIESLKELSGRLAASGMREIPSEEATYAMQFGIDKAPGIGLKPNAGVSDFLEGAKDTAIVAAGAGGVMAGASMGASRLARIKQLREAGETGVADLLQTKHDKQTAVEAVDGEIKAMPGNETFQGHYRNLRTAGIKPAEAAARAATTTVFGQVGEQAGMTPKAIDAALQKASTLPIDQVPGFFAKYTQALAARGLAQPFDGIDQLAGSLEAARDDAIEVAMGAAYSQGDVRQSMDDVLELESSQSSAAVDNIGRILNEPADVLALEKNSAPGADFINDQPLAHAEPAQAAINNIAIDAPINPPNPLENVNVSRNDGVPGRDAGRDQRGRLDPGVGLPDELGVPDAARTAVEPGEPGSRPAAGLVPLASTNTGALNGVLRVTNPQSGAAAQGQAAPAQTAEVAAVDAAGQPATRDAAGGRELQADGVKSSEWVTALGMDNKPTAQKKDFTVGDKGRATIYREADGTLDLSDIKVNDGYRRQGVASQIIDEVFKETGASSIGLSTGTTGDGTEFTQRYGESMASGRRRIIRPDRLGPATDTDMGNPISTPQQLGRNNIPLTEGGKPFKSKLAADTARKGQTTTQTVRVEGGFVLTEKSEALIKAQERAAQRLSNPQTSPRGEAIPAHAFIAAEGGLSPFERADMGIERNVNIGNRKLFAGTGKGLTIERTTEKLLEEGYLQEHDHQKARDLIKRSLTNPQYTPEGTEFMAEKEAVQREADYYAEQEAIALAQEAEDNQFADAADAYEAAMLDYPADAKQSDLSREDAFLVMGFTEQEYQDAIAQESSGPQSSGQAVPGAAQTTTGTRPQGDSGRAPAPSGDSGRGSLEQGKPQVNGKTSSANDGTPRAAPSPAAGRIEPENGSDALPDSQTTKTQVNPAPSPAPAQTDTAPAAITFALRDSGSLAVKGNPAAIRDKLKGITKIAPMEGGMMVGKTQAQRAIDILSDKPAEAPAARPLSVGITPATAEAVTVKDGKVYIGSNEAVNFDSGDAVTVKPGATDTQIVQALKDAGALSRRQKVFGLQDAAQNQSDTQENSDKPAPDALKSAPALEAKPERNEALIELRKRVSVLKAFIKCMGG